MYIDAENRFSNAQSLASGTQTGEGLVSTNTIDLGTERRIGTGKPVYIVAIVTTLLASTGSNDPLAVDLHSDTAEAFDSSTFKQRLGVFPAAAPVGSRIVCAIAPELLNERYIGLKYLSLGDGALTAGAVTAFVTETPDAYAAYPDAVTIS
jgi:hypothetical protein